MKRERKSVIYVCVISSKFRSNTNTLKIDAPGHRSVENLFTEVHSVLEEAASQLGTVDLAASKNGSDSRLKVNKGGAACSEGGAVMVANGSLNKHNKGRNVKGVSQKTRF